MIKILFVFFVLSLIVALWIAASRNFTKEGIFNVFKFIILPSFISFVLLSITTFIF